MAAGHRESHFCINVAEQRGTGWRGEPSYHHLFNTDIVSESQARHVFGLLAERFPAPQYRVTIVHWETVGRTVA